MLDNTFKDLIKILGNTLTIYGYGLIGTRDDDPDYLYNTCTDLEGFYNDQEKTLYLLVKGDYQGDQDNVITHIKFYYDKDLTLSAFTVEVSDYLRGGRNDITVKLPKDTQANIVVSEPYHLEGPGNNSGTSIIRDSGNLEVSYRSFENYIESETHSSDNPRYQFIDDSGRSVSENYTYRVYSNLKIECQGLDYNNLVPCKSGLSYFGGEFDIFGTVDYVEYQVLDGIKKEKSSGTQSIESLQNIELVQEDSNGFLTINRLHIVYPAYKSKNSTTIYARLGDLVSNKIKFTYQKNEPGFQIITETTNLGEYYHNFGVVPVYLFDYEKGAQNSFTVKVENYSKDLVTVENLNTELFDYSIEASGDLYTVTFSTLQENQDTINWQPQELSITSMYFGAYIYRFCLIQKANLSSFDLYDSSAGIKFEGDILVPEYEENTIIRPIPDDNNERNTWFITEFEDTSCGYRQIEIDKTTGTFGENFTINTNSYIPNTVWSKKLGHIKVGRAQNIGIDYWKFYAGLTEKSYNIVKRGIVPELELLTNYEYNNEPGFNRVIDNERIILDEINVYGFIVRSNGPFVCYAEGGNIDFLVNNEHTKTFYSSNHDNVEGIKIYIAERKNDSEKGYSYLGKIKFGIPKKETFILSEDYIYSSDDFLYEKTYKVTTSRDVVESRIECTNKNFIFVDNNTDGLIEFTSTKTPKSKVFDVLGDSNNINSVILVTDVEQQQTQRDYSYDYDSFIYWNSIVNGGSSTRGSSDDPTTYTTVVDYNNIQDLGNMTLGEIDDHMFNDIRRYVNHSQLVTSSFDSSQKFYYPSSIRSIVRETSQSALQDFYVFCKKLPPKLIWESGIDYGNIAFMGQEDSSLTFTILSRYKIKKNDIKFVDVNSIYTTQAIYDQNEYNNNEGNERSDSGIPSVSENQLQIVISYENYYSTYNDYRYKYTITLNTGRSDYGYIGTLRIKSRIYEDSIVTLEKKGKYASYIPESLDIDQDYIDKNIEEPYILDLGIYRRDPNLGIDIFPKGSDSSSNSYKFNVSASGEIMQFQAIPKNKVGEISGDAEVMMGGAPGRFKLVIPSRIENYIPVNGNYSDFYIPKVVEKSVTISSKPEGSDVISISEPTSMARGNRDPQTSMSTNTVIDYSFNFEFTQPGIEYGLFVSYESSPFLYLGDNNEPLEIEVSAETRSLRLFSGVLSLNRDSVDNFVSNIIPKIETDVEYVWLLNEDNEYIAPHSNIELRFPINLTNADIEIPCKFSYTDENSGITHKLEIIIKQKKYSSLIVCPSEVYFNSDGNYLGKDSSDIIYRFEYMYQDISDLTLEIASGTILLEEPVRIIPNYRIQAKKPGFYVYDAYIRLKPNYTDHFLEDETNYLLFMRNNEAISDKVIIKQGYKCSMLSLDNPNEYIYSKQVFGNFDNPCITFSSAHGTIEFIVKQRRQEYKYVDEKWIKGAIDNSFDQIIYASSTYKYSNSGELLQEQDILQYVGLSKILNPGTGYDSEPYAKIIYNFDVVDEYSEFFIISELSIKGYFRDGSEPVSTYKIYMKKVSPDTIYADPYLYMSSAGLPVKTYTFESYYPNLNNSNIEFKEKFNDLGITLIDSHDDRYVYRIDLTIPDNRSNYIKTGTLNIVKDDAILKQIQVQQGYRYAYIINPCTLSNICLWDDFYVDIYKTGELIFQIYQYRREFNINGEVITYSDFATDSGTITVENLNGATFSVDSFKGTVSWIFENLDRSKIGKISFTRTYPDIGKPDYYEFNPQIIIRPYDYYIKSDYDYLADNAKITIVGAWITCNFGIKTITSSGYKISLPFKPKIKRNLIGPIIEGGSYTSCKVGNGSPLTQDDLNDGCVSSKTLDITFNSNIPENSYITGNIKLYMSNGYSKFTILDINTEQSSSNAYY